jgi:hypothetical protein
MEPLFEYRIFVSRLSEIGDLPELPKSEVSPSEEFYLVPTETETFNLKIRDGRLELKALIDQDQGLERWQPIESVALPIPRDQLNAAFLSKAAVVSPALVHADYSASMLMLEVAVPSNELELCKVNKRRRKVLIEDCAAEVVSLDIGDLWHAESVAIGAKTTEVVLKRAREWGLMAYPNQSYPALIKGLMGLSAPAPVPEER